MARQPKHMRTTGERHPTAQRHSNVQRHPTAQQHSNVQRHPTAQQHSNVQSSKSEQIGRSTAMMSGLVIVSRITGFVRTWAQAYALGVTVIASCYAVANNLPTQLYEIVVGGMLVTAFLPVYLSEKERAGRLGGSAYASNLISIVVVLMGLLTILCIVFAGAVIWTQSFSATDDFNTELTIYFFRFFAIEVLLYALSSILSGILNAERDYFWSNAAPIFNNFVTIASFLSYAFLVDTAPTLALLMLALGNPLGVLIQVVIQMPALARRGIRLRWHIDLRHPSIRETVSIGIPSLIVTVASFETTSVMTSAALSVTAVGASVISYARLWFTLPYAIFAVPITTAMFTELSDDIVKGDMRSYREGVTSGISDIVFRMIPFALFLVVFATPLVTIMAAGSFSSTEIELTASYLCALAVSLPVYGVCTYLQKVCSSLRRMQLFTGASVVAAILQTVICLTLTSVGGLNVVALSSTVYMASIDVVTLVFLHRELGQVGIARIVVSCVRGLTMGIAGSLVGILCGFVIPSSLGLFTAGSIIHSFVRVVLGGIPALLVTFGGACLLRMPEADSIISIVRRRR